MNMIITDGKRTARNLIVIAKSQIGYCEKESNSQLDDYTANAGHQNYTKFARDLRAAGYYQASKQGADWCDVFVDHCFWVLCGRNRELAESMTCQTGLYGAGCYFSAKYYKQKGRLFYSDPQPGDQIFFGDYDHTGIVEKAVNEKLYTIEGNAGDRVIQGIYQMDNPWITAFGRPFYESCCDNQPDLNQLLDVLAAEVISGYWGNGSERIKRLTDAGYNYQAVQDRVNALIANNSINLTDRLARECISGLWGNGNERKCRLIAAGYDYDAVQQRINEILK